MNQSLHVIVAEFVDELKNFDEINCDKQKYEKQSLTSLRYVLANAYNTYDADQVASLITNHFHLHNNELHTQSTFQRCQK